MSEIAEVRRRILEENDRAAAILRRQFAERRALVVDLVSSPGSGKTTLLEQTLARLQGKLRAAVVVGDVATERDAERIRALGVPAHQIITGGACHLDARLLGTALGEARFDEFDVLFVENVGNLVCPASYDLGEDFKVVLLSVAEGDDKPCKYPAIFSRADVAVITKSDLLPHSTFDLEAVRQEVRSLRPNGELLVTSARTGEGMDAWCELLVARLEAKRGAAAAG